MFANQSYSAMEADTNYMYKKFGQVSKLILESFFKFVLRAEHFGKRTTEQWAQIPDEIGENAVTKLMVWTTKLRSRVIGN